MRKFGAILAGAIVGISRFLWLNEDFAETSIMLTSACTVILISALLFITGFNLIGLGMGLGIIMGIGAGLAATAISINTCKSIFSFVKNKFFATRDQDGDIIHPAVSPLAEAMQLGMVVTDGLAEKPIYSKSPINLITRFFRGSVAGVEQDVISNNPPNSAAKAVRFIQGK